MYKRQCLLITFILLFISSFSLKLHATTVQFQTALGDFEVNLYDQTTSATVDNFLAYVNAGSYSNIIIHRSVADFIVQGGGFTYDGELDSVLANTAVVNEPLYSNVRGTISMAKMEGNPNSATNQWFFNLADNSANLDVQNGGFTAFGEVTGNGMEVVDAMAALPLFNLGGALSTTPLRDFTADDATNGVTPDGDNFVLIYDVVVLDAAEDTAASLNPAPNTLINTQGSSDDGSGGGSFGFILFATLLLLCFKRSFCSKN